MGPTLLTGRVVNRSGNPVGGAAVYIMEGPVPTPDIALLTSGDGRFSLSIPAPGRYRIGIAAQGHQPHEEVVDVGESSPATLEIHVDTGGQNDA